MVKKAKMNMNMKITRDMVENAVIAVLLVIILVLLVQYYLKNVVTGSESFQSGDARLVLYYAPWCPHCTNFLPEWKNMGGSKKVNGTNVEIEAIDCDAKPEVAERENISGFPTVKLHLGDKVHEYDGARDTATLVLWVEKMV